MGCHVIVVDDAFLGIAALVGISPGRYLISRYTTYASNGAREGRSMSGAGFVAIRHMRTLNQRTQINLKTLYKMIQLNGLGMTDGGVVRAWI